MKPWLLKVVRSYRLLVSNIAFIPTIMGVLSVGFAILMLYLDNYGYTDWANEDLGFALVKGADNARMILTTIIGGILSLTVFSFSMVMVVLNRATASLSPRVLPQLIANKSHQLVLGAYMGTIVYSLMLVVNINESKSIPSFSILLSMIFAINSLGLFIYFIHSISKSIQVDNILGRIFKNTVATIEQLKKNHHSCDTSKYEFTDCYVADTPGYYQIVPQQKLLKKVNENNQLLRFCTYPQQFVLKGAPVLQVGDEHKAAFDTELLEEAIRHSELPMDDDGFISGFRKISEIGVKALSPGINDPGTAIRVINVLNVLFTKLYPYPLELGSTYDYDNVMVIKNQPTLSDILDTAVIPIRQCIAGEKAVAQAMLNLYSTLLDLAADEDQQMLQKQLTDFKYELNESSVTKYDLKILEKQLKELA